TFPKGPALRGRSREAVDGKRARVFLGILAVVDAIEQRDLLFLSNLHGDAELLHRLEIHVRTHDFLGYAGVVGSALGHAPAAELREPPLAIDLVRVVTVAIRIDHVERI